MVIGAVDQVNDGDGDKKVRVVVLDGEKLPSFLKAEYWTAKWKGNEYPVEAVEQKVDDNGNTNYTVTIGNNWHGAGIDVTDVEIVLNATLANGTIYTGSAQGK